MEFAPDGPMAIPLWINGHAYLTVTTGFFDVQNPVTGAAMRRVPLCGAVEAEQAMEAARQAQRLWADSGLQARRVCLARLADALDRYTGHFAKLIVQDTGMDEVSATAEVSAAVDCLRSDAVAVNGVVAIVVDATRPLLGLVASLAPVVISGGTVVIKPSPRAPSAAYALCELSARCEWPAGVVNLLHGDTGAIEGLCAMTPDRLRFFGAPDLAAQVAEIAARHGVAFEVVAP